LHYQKIAKKNSKIIELPYIQRLAKKFLIVFINTGSRKRVRGVHNLPTKNKACFRHRVRKGPKRTENYGKYPHHPIRKAEDFDLLPEQLLPYFTINKNGKHLGLDKP
jgi:hypothetical protein